MPEPAARLLPVENVLADEQLTERWDALADAADPTNPFLRRAFLGAAVRHLAAEDDVRLLVVDGEQEWDLLAPLSIGQRTARLPGRPARAFQHDQALLGTPLARDHRRAWGAALRGLAAADAGSWALFEGVDARVAEQMASAARHSRLAVRVLEPRARALAHRRDDGRYLERTLSSGRRKKLRRLRRRLSEDLGGGLELVDLVERDGPEKALEQFMDLEAAGWKGEDGGALASNPAQQRMMREAITDLARAGIAHVYGLLGADGTLAAAAIDLADGPGLFTAKITYDEQHASRSPGRLLEEDQFDRFHRMGLDWIDSCASPNDDYQHELFGGRRELTTVFVSLGGVRGTAAVHAAATIRVLQLRWRAVRRWLRERG